jgi:hypothetical protein
MVLLLSVLLGSGRPGERLTGCGGTLAHLCQGTIARLSGNPDVSDELEGLPSAGRAKPLDVHGVSQIYTIRPTH